MGKADVGSPKWLDNKMKAKGLGKLRWYCQMCEKQCRDENGFKCHRQSDQHMRQMALFCSSPGKFMNQFSSEFEKTFMLLMSTRYCGARVLANTVYVDMISDKHHMHMNGTTWVTLGNFVQYLGRTGKCKIDKTPKGWYLEYIDRSPEKLQREEDNRKRAEQEAAQKERHSKMLNRQSEIDRKSGKFIESEFTTCQRVDDEKVVLSMNMPDKVKVEKKAELRSELASVFGDTASSSSSKPMKKEQTEKRSVMASMMEEHEKAKRQKLLSCDWWISPQLIVKVMHKTVAEGAYYKKKGKIRAVKDRYTAEVVMDDGAVISLDQEMLETVIPGEGKPVMIVKGEHREHRGKLKCVDMQKLCCTVELLDKTLVEGLQWEDVCKI